MKLRATLILIVLAGNILFNAFLANAAPDQVDKAPFYGYPQELLSQMKDTPDRHVWQKPEQVADHLLIKPGDVIADIGAGNGYFTSLFSKRVGKSGLVYAVDVDKFTVAILGYKINKEGLTNVRAILGEPHNPLLPKASTDLIFLCNTYMFIGNRGEYLARLKEILKDSGRLAIVSLNKMESPEGPPLEMRISRETTLREVEHAGFVLEEEYFFLPYQHFLVFGKR